MWTVSAPYHHHKPGLWIKNISYLNFQEIQHKQAINGEQLSFSELSPEPNIPYYLCSDVM